MTLVPLNPLGRIFAEYRRHYSSIYEFLNPLEDPFSYCHCLVILVALHRWRYARVASDNREPGEFLRFLYKPRNLPTGAFQQCQQLGNIVNIGKVYPILDQECFDGLFRRLLYMKTQVLQVNALCFCSCYNQVAVGSVQPFPGIVRRIPFRHDRPPYLLAGRAL